MTDAPGARDELIEILGVRDVTEGGRKFVLEGTEGVIGELIVAPTLCKTPEDTMDTVMGARLEIETINHQPYHKLSLANHTLKKTLSCLSIQSYLQLLHRWHQPPTGWREAAKAKNLLVESLGSWSHPLVERFGPIQLHCKEGWGKSGPNRFASRQLKAQLLCLLE